MVIANWLKKVLFASFDEFDESEYSVVSSINPLTDTRVQINNSEVNKLKS